MDTNPENAYSSTVRFFLNGELVELENVSPTRTVLQFLREELGISGTKEGCAEGDCGACTVTLVDLDRAGDRLCVRAVNSCIQFLPTLHGRELLTVEGLKNKQGELHPVQQAMLECHGSQCGFCTPGFVMSMFALFKNSGSPGRREIDDALAGNLCRCTGYQPIVVAAEKMYGLGKASTDDWMELADSAESAPGEDEIRRVSQLRKLRSGKSLRTENDGRRFFAPVTIDEMDALLGEFPDATVLAGGTDIGLWVTKQYRELSTVIYTAGVREMVRIDKDDDGITVGAAVTLTDILPLIVERYPTLRDLFVRFASPPIRNAGTLGGNVANGSPIGDSMPALLALDAELVLRGGGETRTVALDDFYIAYQKTVLRTGEFVQAIRIPALPKNAELRCYKISKRFDQDISAVCGAFRATIENGDFVDVRIAFGGLAEVPKRAREAERALADAHTGEESVRNAMRALQSDFQPITDMRASAAYRAEVCQNLLYRFWLETGDSAPSTDVYGYGR